MGRKLLTAKRKRKVKKVVPKNPWFRKRDIDTNWGFIPINWQGWISLILLIGINVFAANYFNVRNAPFEGVSKFLVVFLLSMTVFVLVAEQRTKE